MTTYRRNTRPGRTARRGAGARKAVLVVLRFLLINILFFAVTSPFVAFYGPFTNIKSAVIGSIITSKHHDWLRYVLSKDEIARYTPRAVPTNNGTPGDGIDIPTSPDSDVSLLQVTSSRFQGWLLEVTDPTRVELGVTANLGVKGELTSEIARDNGALAAVNAGGFDDPAGTGNGRTPYGVIIHNGYIVYGADIEGRVPLIGLDNKGKLITGDYNIREMRQLNIRDAISFGPNQTLIQNGKKQVTSAVNAEWGISPRTAIGQKRDGTIMLLVIDGRQTDSLGATLLDVQNILYDYGAYTAANLDGGSSTTMYFDGRVINHPCDPMGERLVPTAFIVK
jgi:exopolysaccharide biosynthesis protein